VCDALDADGNRNLRKGGIAERARRLSFRHREVFLFPTFFHEQIAKVRIAAGGYSGTGQHHRNSVYARVERAVRINSLAIAKALAPLHILQSKWCESVSLQRRRLEMSPSSVSLKFPRLGFAR